MNVDSGGQCTWIVEANVHAKHTCLKYEGFICYFDPHGSEHHPTLVDPFHTCRFPPSRSHTPSKLDGDSFQVA